MTPPSRSRKKKAATPVPHVEDQFSWTTVDELTFLRGLGMDVFCDRETRESRLSRLAPRRILLQRYIDAMPLRKHWGAIDAVKVGVHTHAMLKAMADDQEGRENDATI